MSTGANYIANERARQISRGYTPQHDLEHHGALDLIRASSAYIDDAGRRMWSSGIDALIAEAILEAKTAGNHSPEELAELARELSKPAQWPFESKSWSRPSSTIDALAKAGAMIAAAIDTMIERST